MNPKLTIGIFSLSVAGATFVLLMFAQSSEPGSTIGKDVAAAATSVSPTARAIAVPTGEPQTYEGVKAAVDRIDGSRIDGGAQWDMLTSSGQASMTRDDYAKVINGCPKLLQGETIGVSFDGTSATVQEVDVRGNHYDWHMVYESGHWKHQPSDGAMLWMKLGADKALRVMKNEGVC